LIGQDKLDRINQLSAKAKSEGLTEIEIAEQKELREAYLKAFRNNFKKQLDNIEIVYKD